MIWRRLPFLWLAVMLHGVAGYVLKNSVTPIEKVVKLLEDLKVEIDNEGKAEASVYEAFACFCKDSTDTKSASIIEGQDTIDSTSAAIEADTATQATKMSDLADRQMQQEALEKELKETINRCLKESAEFEANVADLTKAVYSLDKAISAMKSKKPAAAALISLRAAAGESLKLAAALQLIKEPKQRALRAFLQQRQPDPDDPEYKFKSQGIIDTLEQLHQDFTTELKEEQDEWDKHTVACDAEKKSLRDEISSNGEAISTLKEEIDKLKTSIAENKVALIQAENLLADDQLYLKDLTARCEARAKDFDQRSSLRKSELEALTEALAILTDKVQAADVAVNKRAMMIVKANKTAVKAIVKTANKTNTTRAVSLLQVDGAVAASHDVMALSYLKKQSLLLQSPVLSALATRVEANPFENVKKLIQQLIERLLAESTQEATKKGFCDEELGKAMKTRDFRLEDTQKLSAEIEELEATKQTLAVEISELTQSANETSAALTSAAQIRSDEKTVNTDSIAKAKEGLEAVSEAIAILKDFYKTSLKAKSFLQESPVEPDDPGAGFKGAYTGKQEASTGILALLDVIKSDFERTIKTTTAEEKRAAAEFVDFDRSSRTSIAEKEKGVELKTQELQSTETALTQKMEDLVTAQGLLDAALKSMDDLKPMCIDNTMSYSERVQKREEEIAALKNALCLLDTEGVEDECK